MSSSRHTRRRQQNSYRRHRMRLESLEKRYALNAAPTDIVLNAPPLPEGPPAERFVGQILTTDPDVSPGGIFITVWSLGLVMTTTTFLSSTRHHMTTCLGQRVM